MLVRLRDDDQDDILKSVICVNSDLADLDSVQNFVKEFSAKHKQLHILVNNGMPYVAPRRFTSLNASFTFCVKPTWKQA